MSLEARDELVALFGRANAMPSAERESFLAELGRKDPAARRELEELLAQDERGGPLPSAASAKHSLVQSLVDELAREGAPEVPSNVVLEKLAARTPAASRYSIQGELARGGMGAILEVWDEDIGRSLAMKVALGSARPQPDAETPHVDARTLARFLEEAQVTGQLDHPGIVPVHELGLDHAGRAFFTMRLVKGRDLEAILALVRRGEEGWTQTRALGVLLKVCEAMSYAHSNSVVHRDLKPANVMIGRFGEVYVMDWGLARARGRRTSQEARAPSAAADALAKEGQERRGLLATEAGTIMGTPAYMPPEQAAGRLEEVDARSDVYAVGAMLYQLLVGQRPYCGPDEEPSPLNVITRVLAGPPAPIHMLAPSSPAELIAICEKAMARAPLARYRDVGELGEDLRAFIERRVVRAYETGAWAEARKWVRRNRGFAGAIAAGILALVAGLTASLVLRAQSEDRRRLAEANELRALASESQTRLEKARADSEAEAATKGRDEVLRLSALHVLDDLVAEADRLWPAHPENIQRYESWLGRAAELVAELPTHEAKLAELRAQTRPWTPEEQAEHRASHSKAAELENARRHLEFHHEQRSAFESGVPLTDPSPAEVGVDFASLPADANGLNELAWPLVDPERKEWGGEAKGLVLARRAVALAPDAERAGIRDTLAWALFAAGRFDEAVTEEETALEEAGEERRPEFEGYVAKLKREIDSEIDPDKSKESAEHATRLETDIAALEQEISTRLEWTFDDAQDKWWHNQLEKLVGRVKAFSDPATGLFWEGTSPEHGWGVMKRLDFSSTIVERSVSSPEAATKWSEAIASIGSKVECPAYRGLVLAPQLGLIPIGRDPDSGLWEFSHLETGEPAERGPGGKLVLDGETGLVLVLLPGGTFLMGAQSSDPAYLNYDPQALKDEGPVHEVALSPFFLSKYEMTQGQWLRFAGRNPSQPRPGVPTNLLHPVQLVSWKAGMELCERMGLTLPSEAQWEYAARGGTATTWWTGNERESLQGAANVADSFAKSHGGAWWPEIEESLDDGHTVDAPVGSYRANEFGLHDVMGNIWEWCKDGYDPGAFSQVPGIDPVFGGHDFRIVRGGCFATGALHSRSSARSNLGRSQDSDNIGLRPARRVTP